MLTKHSKAPITHRSKANLPSPSNISLLWNFGSLLGVTLIIQMLTGILLAAHYTTSAQNAFQSLTHISRDVNLGWLLQNTHSNGASLFFIFIYLHIARGLYHGSYLLKKTWMAGITLLLLTMLTAFAGYILPWGQMSFWAATVITNLISAIPYIGTPLVEWVWGGFSVDSPTLNRIFALHFAAPFMIAATAMIHMMLLHEHGSNNPTGLNSNTDKIPFHPYFTFKDLLGVIWALLLIFSMILLLPNLFSEPENFIMADPLTTPSHIKPEWYFLFAYAILRTIPNKLGGVMALACSILILALFPMLHLSNQQSMTFRPGTQLIFWTFISTVVILTWIGGNPTDYPLTDIGQIAALLYFTIILLAFPTITWLENKF